MKRILATLLLLALSVFLVAPLQVMAQSNAVNWDSFRANLVANLSSENHGVRESALQMISQYSKEFGFQDEMAADPIWVSFKENLETNLASSNHGVRQSAMRLIIQYGDRLDLDRSAIFELVRVYRSQKDLRYRQMALAALHKTRDQWAMGFLKTSLKFEDSQVLKHQIQAILADYKANAGP